MQVLTASAMQRTLFPSYYTVQPEASSQSSSASRLHPWVPHNAKSWAA
jgi:hypothetical protein